MKNNGLVTQREAPFPRGNYPASKTDLKDATTYCNDAARHQESVFTSQRLGDPLAAFAHLGMAARQEEEILELVRRRSEQLIDIYDIAGETRVTLEGFGIRLGGILEATRR